MTGRTARRRVLRVRIPAGPGEDARADLLAVEEPLEIRVGGEPLAVTMRTPGDDIDLAAGFLASEGVIATPSDVTLIKMCDDNVADVTLDPGITLPDARLRRNFVTSSACGVCGKDSIDAIRVRASYDVSADPVRVSPGMLASLPRRLSANWHRHPIPFDRRPIRPGATSSRLLSWREKTKRDYCRIIGSFMQSARSSAPSIL